MRAAGTTARVLGLALLLVACGADESLRFPAEAEAQVGPTRRNVVLLNQTSGSVGATVDTGLLRTAECVTVTASAYVTGTPASPYLSIIPRGPTGVDMAEGRWTIPFGTGTGTPSFPGAIVLVGVGGAMNMVPQASTRFVCSPGATGSCILHVMCERVPR